MDLDVVTIYGLKFIYVNRFIKTTNIQKLNRYTFIFSSCTCVTFAYGTPLLRSLCFFPTLIANFTHFEPLLWFQVCQPSRDPRPT